MPRHHPRITLASTLVLLLAACAAERPDGARQGDDDTALDPPARTASDAAGTAAADAAPGGRAPDSVSGAEDRGPTRDAGTPPLPSSDAGTPPPTPPDAATTPPPPPPPSGDGIWIGPDELSALPTSGAAWNQLKQAADSVLADPPDLSARNREGVQVLAKALAHARTGDESYRQQVIAAMQSVIGTEGGDALATFRGLGSYVLAADLVGLPAGLDATFRDWLRQLLDPAHAVGSRSLVSTHEVQKANNWGTMAGFSRAAAAVYLRSTDGDAELQRTATVFRGWLGDRAAYTFPDGAFGDLSWQCDAGRPVGINPKGCRRDGHSIDGVLPDDQRRAGGFNWPPPKENYVYGALQGAVPTAVILYRAGFTDVWQWSDQALLRAFSWLYDEADFPASDSDDQWVAWLIDYHYCTGGRFHLGQTAATNGKTVGWTDWTHASEPCAP
jgi:hypothetical protein